MPKSKKNQGRVSKTLHPNSRKAKKKCKLAWRDMKLDKQKTERKRKMQILGEKLMWFHSHLDTTKSRYTNAEMDELVQQYFRRFDDEFEQIALANSIGSRKQRHGARLDTLRFILQQDRREYHSIGLELPNLLDTESFQAFSKWNGEMRFYSSIPMMMFCKEGNVARRKTKISTLPKKKVASHDEGNDLGDNSDMFIEMSAADDLVPREIISQTTDLARSREVISDCTGGVNQEKDTDDEVEDYDDDYDDDDDDDDEYSDDKFRNSDMKVDSYNLSESKSM